MSVDSLSILLFACRVISRFFICPYFSKLTISKNYFRYTIWVLNSLDPDQPLFLVGPDLGPNCLQKLSADDTSMQGLNGNYCMIWWKRSGFSYRASNLSPAQFQFSTSQYYVDGNEGSDQTAPCAVWSEPFFGHHQSSHKSIFCWQCISII